MALAAAAEQLAGQFQYTTQDVNSGVDLFLKQLDEGLRKTSATLPQIPTYVTAVPNGTEKGLYMAVDLGGTNFRVCSIKLHGDTTFSLTQSKVPIPRDLMLAKTYKELFAFLARQIQAFLQTHHNEHYQSHLERRGSKDEGWHDEEIFSLGFTFSFPVTQSAINRGTLMRWTKGFDIPDAIGQDVCVMLQTEIDTLKLPVKVAALVNDTVGTLIARSYTSPGKSGTLLGAIFGTGTNGAYVERLQRIQKLASRPESDSIDKPAKEMIINCEWGSFDNTMYHLPNTTFDKELDAESVNPGFHMFEKRVSGMFLGEILRRAILQLTREPKNALFTDSSSAANDLHSTTCIDGNSPLYQKWGLDTAFLSTAHGDDSPGLRLTRQALDKDLSVSASSEEDARAVQKLATAIGLRSARLAAVAIGSIVIASGKLKQQHSDPDANIVDIGVDGSLVEFYPHFEKYVREGLREIASIGDEGEKRIRIGIAKDGSGVGAALIALVADKAGVAAPA